MVGSGQCVGQVPWGWGCGAAVRGWRGGGDGDRDSGAIVRPGGEASMELAGHKGALTKPFVSMQGPARPAASTAPGGGPRGPRGPPPPTLLHRQPPSPGHLDPPCRLLFVLLTPAPILPCTPLLRLDPFEPKFGAGDGAPGGGTSPCPSRCHPHWGMPWGRSGPAAPIPALATEAMGTPILPCSLGGTQNDDLWFFFPSVLPNHRQP